MYSIKRRKVTIVEETVTCDRRADQQGNSESSESQLIAALPSTSVTSTISQTTSDEPPLTTQNDVPKDNKSESSEAQSPVQSGADHPASAVSKSSDTHLAADEPLDLTSKKLPVTDEHLPSYQSLQPDGPSIC